MTISTKKLKNLTIVNLYLIQQKLALIRLCVHNSVFTVNRGNTQFLYASGVLDSSSLSPINSSSSSSSTSVTSSLSFNTKSKITCITN